MIFSFGGFKYKLCIMNYALIYKLSPKSSLNLAISFCGQSEVGSSPPIKKRSTGGSYTNFNPPMSKRLSYSHFMRSSTYFICDSVNTPARYGQTKQLHVGIGFVTFLVTLIRYRAPLHTSNTGY